MLSILSVIPIIINQFKFTGRQFWLSYNQTPIARETQYINFLLTNKDSAKEIRVLGLRDFLLNRWANLYFKTGKEVLNLSKRNLKIASLLDAVSHMFIFGSYLIIIYSTINKTLKIGEFVTSTQAVQGLQGSILQVGFNLSSIYSDSLYLKDLFNFLDLSFANENEDKDNINNIRNSIRFENVSFSYPNTHQAVLKNVNFEIKKGETIAIVGENGSGKSTLVKCLMGLYEPDKGEILFDDIPLSKINKCSLWENLSVVFQDFIKYNFTIKDNITFGNVKERNNSIKLKDAAKKCGLNGYIDQLEDGYNSFLGKYLKEGVDFSGGQWQRLAIARAIFKDSEILILDEPTASVDPNTELQIFEKFKELSVDKTTIIISHRLATTTFADRILVLKNGEIEEVGTYRELMHRKGHFYKMYNSQSKWYSKEVI